MAMGIIESLTQHDELLDTLTNQTLLQLCFFQGVDAESKTSSQSVCPLSGGCCIMDLEMS